MTTGTATPADGTPTPSTAGAATDQQSPLPETSYTLASGGSFTWMKGWSERQVRQYAAQERAAERERCAQIAGDNYGWVAGSYFDNLADAIRGGAPDSPQAEIFQKATHTSRRGFTTRFSFGGQPAPIEFHKTRVEVMSSVGGVSLVRRLDANSAAPVDMPYVVETIDLVFDDLAPAATSSASDTEAKGM